MATVKLRILGECVIEVGERRIGPEAPQLFALLLYLGMASGRAVHKTELFELLFPGARDGGRASHNLRQLLYRLRGMGVDIALDGEQLRLTSSEVSSNLADFALMPRKERLHVGSSKLTLLPCYEPRISPQLTDWVESLRSQMTLTLRSVLREDFRSYQRECDWESVVTGGNSLLSLDDSSQEAVSGIAEALLMLGRKLEALDVIDNFLADCDPSSVHALRQLRGRIARAKQTIRPLQSSFHGRAAEMRSLSRQWSSVLESLPQVAVIVGPPGIGKTRLSKEFSAYVSLHSGQTLTYRCDASDNTRPHSLFKQLLPQLRSLRGSLGASPALQHHLARLLDDESTPTTMEPAALEATRRELQLALIDLLDAVASETNLLLVIDDAQFLDLASRAVLEAITDRQRQIAIMLYCAYRGIELEGSQLLKAETQVLLLAPLTHDQSIAVLHELLPQRSADHAFLETCVAQAHGNPYYLHAIAQSRVDSDAEWDRPFDIRTFAASSYFSLTSDARTLFESSVLLGRFANLQRVRAIACLDGPPLLAALRILEDQGLLVFAQGELRCAHALLEDATRALIPSAVAAALHERIASYLENDASLQGYSPAITAAAAESWLAAGDAAAASRLLQHCAAHAARLGEPSVAASTLVRVPLQLLPVAERVSLLHHIVEYAEIAGNRELVCASLRDLLNASHELSSPAGTLQELEFRIIEADLLRGSQPVESLPPLTTLLANSAAPLANRARAGIRLLIAADMILDSSLAKSTITLLTPVLSELGRDDPLRLRAELIYETVFGDQRRALSLSVALLASHQTPSLTQATVNARRNVAFALSRMGLRSRANPVLTADYRFMAAHHVSSEAAYSALLLADHSLADGCTETASRWIDKAGTLVNKEPGYQSLQASYLTAVASVAVEEGRFEDAESVIAEAYEQFPAEGFQRFRSVVLAIRIKVQLARGLSALSFSDLEELQALYALGGHLGAQDSIVEALWLSEYAQGDAYQASVLLIEYLCERRRELGPPEASLRATTGADRAWSAWDALKS